MRKRWVVLPLVAAVVVVAVVIVVRTTYQHAHRTDLQRALALVPADAQRISFTDWAGVRQALHQPTSADPGVRTVKHLMRRAYDRDFSAASAINDSGALVQRYYGFSPGNADWEAYAQSKAGAAMLMHLPDRVSFDDLADTLRALGYRRPDSTTGVWRGGADLVSSINPLLSPELQYIVLLPDAHLVVTSDTADYVTRAGHVAGGHGRAVEDSDDVSDMADRVGDPVSAVVWAGDYACADLSMGKASRSEQRQADRLIARAGTTNPLTGLVMAMAADRDLTVAEQFADDEQARDNLQARAELAVGPAVGRGGSNFSEDFRLTRSRTVGSTVLLDLHPRPSTEFVLSALYDGPLIFATC